MHLLDTEPFENTFGKKAQRKRPRLTAGDLQVCVDNESMADCSCSVVVYIRIIWIQWRHQEVRE